MNATKTDSKVTKFKLTLDGWAVTFAFALALLMRVGVLKRVPW